MSDFEARMGTAEAHCDELLEDGYVLLASEPCPDGSFNVWTSTGGAMSSGKAEAFLFELAHAILKNTDACSTCAACQDRKLRVERALVALDYPHVRPGAAA